MEQTAKTIVLSGGGTLGSVVPLIALADDLKNDYRFVFIGTAQGPEQTLVKAEGLPFQTVAAGKLRRYWSWRNLTDPFLFLIGLAQSLVILKKVKPSLVIMAGSFVSVGVALAAWCLRIPILVQQLDYVPGLANKLIARLARRIIVSWQKSVKDYGERAVWTGSPVRRQLLKTAGKSQALKFFKLTADKPIVLVVGGGTGAAELNRLVIDNLYNLTQICQVIHLTGRGKETKTDAFVAYRQFASLGQTEMALAYAAADVVVSRAGMGTLAELAYLAKPAIIIPMPESHQEANAKILAEAKAAKVFQQPRLSSLELYHQIKALLADEAKRQSLGQNLQQLFKADANEAIIKIIKEILNS
jgi:UDP-N-acetylglucosamine--N-acetylmuramyl-(pentapeptide) pyrophosphoryl-undecaprenol N-acetylglucosamine transferase